MAVKVSSLLRHLKKIKVAQRSEVRLLLSDGSTRPMPNILKAFADFIDGVESEDSVAIQQAVASKGCGNLLTLAQMVGFGGDDDASN